jgi:hypothetical protein
MAVNLSALAGAGQQFFDNSGNPLSGGKLWSYAAGTTTPQTTYTTAAGNVAHANPIILDAAGRVATGEIWLTAGSNYKFVLMTSTDVTLVTWDNITGINGTGIASNAENVAYDPPFTSAVQTNVEAKLAETVSVKDFGAVGNGIADDTAAFQAALNVGGYIFIPDGIYLVTSSLTVAFAVRIYGGKGAQITYSNASAALFSNAAVSSIAYFEANGFSIESTFTRAVMSSIGTFDIRGAAAASFMDLDISGGSIRLLNATYANIERNKVLASNGIGDTKCDYGIVTFDAVNVTISDNLVGGFSNDGIKLGVTGPTATTSSKTVVTGNKVYDSATNHIDVFDGGRNCVVSGNILYGTCNTALEIKSQGSTPGAFGAGGSVWPNATNSERVVVSNNNVSGALVNGVLCYGRYYDISHNVIADASSRGVVVGSFDNNTDEAFVHDIGIVGNIFIDNATGVFVRNSKKGVRICDNSFVGKSDGTKDNTGIVLGGKNQTTIANNSFKNLNYAVNSAETNSAEMMVSITGNILNNVNLGLFFFSPTTAAKISMIGNSAENVTTPVGTVDGFNISRGYIQYANSWQPNNNIQLQTVGNVGTGETDLLSYVLPANSLTQVFQGLQITAWGTTTSSADSKTIKLYFGSQVILTTSLTTSQASNFRITAQVYRTGGDTQTYTSQCLQGGTTQIVDVERGNPTQIESATITIKLTATVGGAGANNDLTVSGMTVTSIPF